MKRETYAAQIKLTLLTARSYVILARLLGSHAYKGQAQHCLDKAKFLKRRLDKYNTAQDATRTIEYKIAA